MVSTPPTSSPSPPRRYYPLSHLLLTLIGAGDFRMAHKKRTKITTRGNTRHDQTTAATNEGSGRTRREEKHIADSYQNDQSENEEGVH